MLLGLGSRRQLFIMKIYFSHGKESGPRGTKIKRLAAMAEDMGCAVDSVDYTDLMDPELRVERLLEVLAEENDDFVLVAPALDHAGLRALGVSVAMFAHRNRPRSVRRRHSAGEFD